MFKTFITAVAVLTVLGTSACTLDSSSTKEAKSAGHSPESPKSSKTKSPPPKPKPNVKYGSSCDYLLGNFTSFTQAGYRFTGDATLHNVGNIGVVVRVTFTWLQAGGQKITRVKLVRVAAGKSVRTGMIVPTGSDQIDQYQNLSYGKNCSVKATMIKEFGKVRR